MILTQLSNAQIPGLSPLVQDRKTVGVVLTSDDVATAAALQLRPIPASVAPAGTDVDELLTVLRNFALPVLAAAWPDAKPYINGGLAVWGTVDAWKKLRDPGTDATGKTIAVTQASASVVNALIGFQSQSSAAQIAGTVATSAIGVADKLHTKRTKEKAATQQGRLGSLSAGYIIGTDRGMFAFLVDELPGAEAASGAPSAGTPPKRTPPPKR